MLLSFLFKWEVVLVIMALRFICQFIIVSFISKKLDEQDLLPYLPFLEFFLVVFHLTIFISNLISKPKHWKMAGKTGTAQVRRISKAERETGVLKNNELEWESRDHALFVGYAPFDNPKYAVACVVEHGGSGSITAAPIVKKVFNKLYALEKMDGKLAAAPVTKQDAINQPDTKINPQNEKPKDAEQ